MDTYTEIALAIRKAKKITVLTGAGISTASGIPDFRSRGGLYDNKVNVEDALSEQQFQENPELFWEYYKDIFNIKLTNQYEPNFGHTYLRELEEGGKGVTILTQNVDGLHRKAGNKHVYELHGTIEKAYCPYCHQAYSLDDVLKGNVPRCLNDSTILKPDVVLFGGVVKHMEEAYEKTVESDLFLTMGTSLNVYPVRDIPSYVQHASRTTKIIINKEGTRSDYMFNHVIHEDINAALKKIKNAVENIKNASQ
ncbi:NAD-dependent protein deacylase [Paenibacillus sp. GSMTC-2017]|uniref:NAD-dependent protein deacylase n=1 Tax=Paenibacillus sp. GSMTC-2017 TaxID=2794350 RepID=UPI0018D9DDFF|nr:NAD-dependent protein deacylase [Paenibacillus sp. GSMTC-2017]MBH5320475.1 NAD-dependent protein deacylase [Paenibacillus sp. GSMTC-2017]